MSKYGVSSSASVISDINEHFNGLIDKYISLLSNFESLEFGPKISTIRAEIEQFLTLHLRKLQLETALEAKNKLLKNRYKLLKTLQPESNHTVEEQQKIINSNAGIMSRAIGFQTVAESIKINELTPPSETLQLAIESQNKRSSLFHYKLSQESDRMKQRALHMRTQDTNKLLEELNECERSSRSYAYR
jgi:hypothetical protein